MRCDLEHSHESTFFYPVWQIWRVLRSYAQNSRGIIEFSAVDSLVSTLYSYGDQLEVKYECVPGETYTPVDDIDCLLLA